MHGFSTPCLFPFLSPSLMQRKSRVERMIYRPSQEDARLRFLPSPRPGRSLAGSGERGWVAPRGPMHNLGRLCIHIHLYQWATGKCKPKVIAPDKNICLVNKYSNEASSQVPQTEARLTGLRRDRR